jgi:hypothetical protein
VRDHQHRPSSKVSINILLMAVYIRQIKPCVEAVVRGCAVPYMIVPVALGTLFAIATFVLTTASVVQTMG